VDANQFPISVAELPFLSFVRLRPSYARYREMLGVDHFIMCCQWPGLPQERVLGSIQRLGGIFAS
jgi:hypothetical protein